MSDQAREGYGGAGPLPDWMVEELREAATSNTQYHKMMRRWIDTLDALREQLRCGMQLAAERAVAEVERLGSNHPDILEDAVTHTEKELLR